MTTGPLLSYRFSDRDGRAVDMAEAWAVDRELALRDVRWLAEGQLASLTDAERERVLAIPARDAGDICSVCGQTVTWVDHLPPEKSDSPVRCLVGVRFLTGGDVEVDDIFRRVGDAF